MPQLRVDLVRIHRPQIDDSVAAATLTTPGTDTFNSMLVDPLLSWKAFARPSAETTGTSPAGMAFLGFEVLLVAGTLAAFVVFAIVVVLVLLAVVMAYFPSSLQRQNHSVLAVFLPKPHAPQESKRSASTP